MDVREKATNDKRLIYVNDIYSLFNQNGIARLHVSDIDTIPRVDAVEVVHGRWEEMHYEGGILDGTNFDRCSVCGYERVFDDPALKTVFKYCPNCGAKMDGGAD